MSSETALLLPALLPKQALTLEFPQPMFARNPYNMRPIQHLVSTTQAAGRLPNERFMNKPDFSKSDLIPAIAQDFQSKQVLMLAYMNEQAYLETIDTKNVCYFSRSRQELWRKGEMSGHIQQLKQLFYDCDSDTILLHVEQIGGAACHEGYESCFFREIDLETGESRVIAERVFDPEEIYGEK